MQFSALWDSLPYSSPSTPDCPGAPLSGGPGSFPGQFWRTGVPSFRRCSTESLHSDSVKYRDVVWPLHWPLHYRVRGWGRLQKKTPVWDNRRQRAVVLCSSGPREASEKLKLCKWLAKKVERLGLERKKGDRGANRYGCAPIMGGFSGR